MSIEAAIEAAYQAMLKASTPADKAMRGARFTTLVKERNAQRTAQEIELLERERGLR